MPLSSKFLGGVLVA